MSDLTFSGTLLPGADPRRARLQLTALFRLTDPAAVEPFFRGGTVTLRRDLPAAEAARLCERLRAAGLDCRVTAAPEAALKPGPAAPEPAAPEPAAPEPAAPNLFQVRPDRPVTLSADIAQLRWLAALLASAVLGAALVALTIAGLLASPPAPVAGASASGVDGAGQLYLLTADAVLLHDRAGHELLRLDASRLGLEALAPPFLVGRDGSLLLHARGGDGRPAPWRCAPAGGACEPMPPGSAFRALAADGSGVIHALDSDGLVRIGKGAAQVRAALKTENAAPSLLSEGGLLYVATGGPMIGVYRPDPRGYGEQLDALLLVPGDFAATGVRDFAFFADQWWVLLEDEAGAVALHRFDTRWGHRGAVPLPAGVTPRRLQPWNRQLLVLDPARPALQRVDDQGRVGAPFNSPLLLALAAEQRRALAWRATAEIAGRGALALALGCALLALLLAADRRRRPGEAPALRLDREHSAFLWFPALAPARRQRARQAAVLTLAALALALAGALGSQLTATLASLALAAFTAGVAGSCTAGAGHVAIAGQRLLVTDHRGVYQGGAAGTFRRRGPFLLRGDVAVNLGCASLPGFPRALDSALARAGVATADPAGLATVAAVLLRARHPLALGAATAFLVALFALAAALC